MVAIFSPNFLCSLSKRVTPSPFLSASVLMKVGRQLEVVPAQHGPLPLEKRAPGGALAGLGRLVHDHEVEPLAINLPHHATGQGAGHDVRSLQDLGNSFLVPLPDFLVQIPEIGPQLLPFLPLVALQL